MLKTSSAKIQDKSYFNKNKTICFILYNIITHIKKKNHEGIPIM